MCTLDPTIDTLTLLVLGLLLGGAGLAGLLAGFLALPRQRWLFLLLVGVMATAGLTAVAVDWPRYLWLPPLFAAGLLLGGAGLHELPSFRRFDHSWMALGAPRQLAAVLFLAGGGLTVAELCRLDEPPMTEKNAVLSAKKEMAAHMPELVPCTTVVAYTDLGRPLPLWEPAPTSRETDLQRMERAYLQHTYDMHLLQTMEPKLDFNCHGWVFANGRCWVRGTVVPMILHDNGYRTVAQPAPGDVAVFRNEQGEVMHTALVRLVREDGSVLLESKWGALGCYLHTPTHHAYGTCDCTYYHTDRGGHLLLGRYPRLPLTGV